MCIHVVKGLRHDGSRMHFAGEPEPQLMALTQRRRSLPASLTAYVVAVAFTCFMFRLRSHKCLGG